jgi:hypothetical protein
MAAHSLWAALHAACQPWGHCMLHVCLWAACLPLGRMSSPGPHCMQHVSPVDDCMLHVCLWAALYAAYARSGRCMQHVCNMSGPMHRVQHTSPLGRLHVSCWALHGLHVSPTKALHATCHQLLGSAALQRPASHDSADVSPGPMSALPSCGQGFMRRLYYIGGRPRTASYEVCRRVVITGRWILKQLNASIRIVV